MERLTIVFLLLALTGAAVFDHCNSFASSSYFFLVDAFTYVPPPPSKKQIHQRKIRTLQLSAAAAGEPTLSRISDDDEGVPIPFIDKVHNSFIECYADSIATVNGVQYTIGVPCDYCVALCYLDDDGELIPIELHDKLMDDVYPICENIVNEQFGDELVLQRTPQTLTLVGELEEDDEEEDDDEEDDEEYDGDDVELLLSFEHRDKEFNLVRLMDPVLLVGKEDPEREDTRLLLTPQESEKVMPILENVFLKFHEDGNTMLP
jgi:hypothetical protein